MFLRKLKNASHTVSFQIMKKVGRTNKVVKHLGTAKTLAEQLDLEEEARLYLEKVRLDRCTFITCLDLANFRILSFGT